MRRDLFLVEFLYLWNIFDSWKKNSASLLRSSQQSNGNSDQYLSTFNFHRNPGKNLFVGQVKVLGFSESYLKVLFMVEKIKDVLLGMFGDLGLSIKSYF